MLLLRQLREALRLLLNLLSLTRESLELAAQAMTAALAAPRYFVLRAFAT